MRSFNWLIGGELAGSARPGLLEPIESDIATIKERGIKLIVNLTEEPSDPPVSHFGLRGFHFPIRDMGVPTPEAAAELCRTVVESLARGEPVLLHCKGGLGRTGTMLACCLVTLGRTAADAIAEIRRSNSAYIQAAIQERFVHHYAECLQSENGATPRLTLGRCPTASPALPVLKLRGPHHSP